MAESAHQVILTDLKTLRQSQADEFESDEPSAIATWRRGHVFTEDGHARWRRLGQSIRVVSAGGPVPDSWEAPAHAKDLDFARVEMRDVVLWGRRQPGEKLWIEVRIPNLMTEPSHHPSDHGKAHADQHVRRVLTVATYRHPDSADVLFHRYQGLSYARTDEDDVVYDSLRTE